MPNTNHHQICCGTDNNLGLIAAIAQDLWTHHQNGATRDQCITEAINIFENNPNAAAIAGTAIWLYATTINRDTDSDAEPAPAVVDAGSALPPLLKVAVSPEGAVAVRATSELLAASLEERARIGERILAAANRLLGQRLDLRGQRLFLLCNPESGAVESVARLAPDFPMPSSLDWHALAEYVTPDELAARLDQVRTGEIRFPDSWKQPMPKLAEPGDE